MAAQIGGSLMKRGYAEDCAPSQQAGNYAPTLRERLIAQKADLTQRLANVDNAIEALDQNPNFEQVLDVIGKV